MADETGLTDEERAELEELRAERDARERAARQAAERAELERLRAEREAAERDREALARDAAARERGRKMMEPDEDLRMAPGQKLAILAVVAIALVWLLVTALS